MQAKLQVGLLAFPDMEVLDFAGPFEVFSVANQLADYALMDIHVIGMDTSVVIAKNGLKILPDIAMQEISFLDFLIIPGGDGSKEVVNRTDVLDWIAMIAQGTRVVATVCSGARIVATLGFLQNKTFATHAEVYEDVIKIEPSATPIRDVRYVDHGWVMTSAGVAAGIDLSLHIVEKYFGQRLKEATATYMEYPLTS